MIPASVSGGAGVTSTAVRRGTDGCTADAGGRSARTRSELLRAAQQRFFRDGYHGTSLEDVARDAGYTKGAVYATFESKGGLFLALCEVVFEPAWATRCVRPDLPPYA